MSKKGYLTAEEYRALRELLGFTQAEAAEFHKVQNMRTIRRWESGDSWVSELACDKISQLAIQIEQRINAGFEQWQKGKYPVTLLIYPDDCKMAIGFEDLPNSVHRAMVYRLYAKIKEAGGEVSIVTFNPQLYMIWLAQHKLKDNQAHRGAWAAEYYQKNAN